MNGVESIGTRRLPENLVDGEAVEYEIEFVTEALPVGLIGIYPPKSGPKGDVHARQLVLDRRWRGKRRGTRIRRRGPRDRDRALGVINLRRTWSRGNAFERY